MDKISISKYIIFQQTIKENKGRECIVIVPVNIEHWQLQYFEPSWRKHYSHLIEVSLECQIPIPAEMVNDNGKICQIITTLLLNKQNQTHENSCTKQANSFTC